MHERENVVWNHPTTVARPWIHVCYTSTPNEYRGTIRGQAYRDVVSWLLSAR